MGKYIHICENCNSEFSDYSKNTRFCSRKCYESHRQNTRKTQIVICPICNKEFLQKHIDQIFCSNECKGKSREDRMECICEYCGVKFSRKKSEVIKNSKHYCSSTCRMNDMFWSDEDTCILIDNYKKLSYKEMSENNIFSVYKSVEEIKRRAKYIGITTSRNWSNDEIEILIKSYSYIDMEELQKLIPNRTSIAICRKAIILGLKSKFYLEHLYSDNENEYLKNNYLHKSNEELGKDLNRTPDGIAQHLLVLDLHRPTEIDSYKNLKNYIRCRLSSWRDSIRESCDFTCALSGERSNIVVHHIRSFNLLFNETIEIINFPLYDSISEYTQKQLDDFLLAFLDIQESYGEYICITQYIHDNFHRIYGYGNNTLEQWNDYIENNFQKINTQ